MIKFKVMFCEDAKKIGLIEESGYNDFFWCLVEYIDDKPTRIVGSDGGEPEDQLLVRDWGWVATEMNKLADRINNLEGAKKD